MIQASIHRAFDDLLHSFEANSNRIALVERNGKTYTYAEFHAQILGARTELEKRGVQKGSKVLVFVPMSVELYAVLEALFSLGATAIFLDPWMKGKKMSQVIRQVKPDLFVVTKKINRIARLLPATWFLRKWIVEQIPSLTGAWIIVPVNGQDNALITFTSGTSGIPKGANRTFDFLYAQLAVLKSHLTRPDTRKYVEFTNFPIVGMADFAMGNTIVIPDVNLMKIHEADPSAMIQQLKTSGANRLIVSPALLKQILLQLNPDEVPLLKEVVTGGAPISTRLIQTCLNQFPQIHFEGIYGSTESEPICITSFHEIAMHLKEPLKGVFTGKPVDAVQVKIIALKRGPVDAETFSKTVLHEKQIGEVVVTGEHVNKNYFENEAAFKAVKIVDEHGQIWHRTGDMGYLENGNLYLVGRDHRVMERNGAAVYPYPLEQWIEAEFDYTDVGYVQTKAGRFIVFIGMCAAPVNFPELMARVHALGYPLDEVRTQTKPLPRDARHRSKLQTETLTR